MLWLAILAQLMGCTNETVHNQPYICADEYAVRTVAPEEVTASGYTGLEVLALAEPRFEVLEVAWQEDRTPSSEVFTLTFGEPTAFREVDQGDGETGCGDRTYVEVDVPVSVTTASGLIEVTPGTATFVGLELSNDEVFLKFSLKAEPSGAYATAIDHAFDEVDKVRLSGAAPMLERQNLALSVWGARGQSGGSSAFYHCYTMSDPDCLVTPGAQQ